MLESGYKITGNSNDGWNIYKNDEWIGYCRFYETALRMAKTHSKNGYVFEHFK